MRDVNLNFEVIFFVLAIVYFKSEIGGGKGSKLSRVFRGFIGLGRKVKSLRSRRVFGKNFSFLVGVLKEWGWIRNRLVVRRNRVSM